MRRAQCETSSKIFVGVNWIAVYLRLSVLNQKRALRAGGSAQCAKDSV
jgi:hypothetical protein